MKQRLLPALLILTLAVFQACKKDRDDHTKEKETLGVYVLYEGAMGQNNSGIACYNLKTGQSDADYFKTVNGYALGETANDLQQYGSKLYCVVSGIRGEQKSFVEVINPVTGKSIKRISFNGTTSAYLPRYIAFYKEKAYVSCYDGKIRRIDTASLAIDSEVETGGATEGVAVANGKLYAANSVHPDYSDAPNKNTVSVIDLNSFSKMKDIPVHYNPQKIFVLKDGNLYLTAMGTWDNTPAAAWQKINSQTDAVETTFNQTIGSFAINGDTGYAIVDPYGTTTIKQINPSSGQIGANFIIDGTSIAMPYGISVNSLNGEVFIGDTKSYTATSGEAFIFSSEGKLNFKFTTGIGPTKAVFVYGDKLKI